MEHVGTVHIEELVAENTQVWIRIQSVNSGKLKIVDWRVGVYLMEQMRYDKIAVQTATIDNVFQCLHFGELIKSGIFVFCTLEIIGFSRDLGHRCWGTFSKRVVC